MTDPALPPSLTLYTTLGCHLCDQAKVQLWPVLSDIGGRLHEVDIADSDDLMARYGTRIPVLSCEGEVTELDWPFAESDIRHWLRRFFS